ncbi:MAG TPA: GNAT family N-acetyltransferase [Candidatus Bathyarchaeota archaeon]|nr:GNAT family N-acetyltransferase [Candidatus Bathyarchaeota archaeon]
MSRIVEVKEHNRRFITEQLEADVIRHIFAYYDIQFDPKHTVMYAALKDQRLRGYILIYMALDYPSVVLEGDLEAAKNLIEYAPKDKFVMHIPPALKSVVIDKFPSARCYVEDWMLVRMENAHFYESNLVRRLRVEEDAKRLAALLSKWRKKLTPERCLSMIKKNPTFGVFVNDEIVSYASSLLQLPQAWMIGGVYTHPKHRNRGYGTLAVSAITKEALKNAEAAVLFVRSDNKPAIRVYRKIGYRKIREKIWVDVGTETKP